MRYLLKKLNERGLMDAFGSFMNFRFCHAVAAVCLVAGTASAAETPPNIVLILADDLGYGDIGCYGNSRVSTPNLDRLAQEGLRFTDFHSNGAQCAPTRAALLTGRYQQRVGVYKVGGHLKEGEVVIAQRLKEAGYATAMFGKWHVSGHYMDETVRQSEMPIDYGFDEYRGLMGGFVDHAAHLTDTGTLDWWHNRELLEEEGYASHLMAGHAVDFIRENAGERPFFVYLALPDIHFPWMTPDDPPCYVKGRRHKNFDKEHNRLGPHEGTPELREAVEKMIESTDYCTGRIVDIIDELGLAENTLVFFTSDNGGYADYSRKDAGCISDMGPLKGQKGLLYEGGHRVPAIARRPGTIPAGGVSEETAITFDLFPTFLELAGLKPPAEDGPNALDGTSLVGLMQNGTPLPERTLFWEHKAQWAVRSGKWKAFFTGWRDPELYDLSEDLGETSDLAARYPERLDSMEKQWLDWGSDVWADETAKASAALHPLEPGAAIFSDRDEVFGALPEAWRGKQFYRSSFEDTRWTVLTGGPVYVFSPPAGVRGSVEPELIQQGFEKTDDPEINLWAGKNCAVFRKDCRVGETVRFCRWGVLVL